MTPLRQYSLQEMTIIWIVRRHQ